MIYADGQNYWIYFVAQRNIIGELWKYLCEENMLGWNVSRGLRKQSGGNSRKNAEHSPTGGQITWKSH